VPLVGEQRFEADNLLVVEEIGAGQQGLPGFLERFVLAAAVAV
jgi:hypothetical protein